MKEYSIQKNDLGEYRVVIKTPTSQVINGSKGWSKCHYVETDTSGRRITDEKIAKQLMEKEIEYDKEKEIRKSTWADIDI
jgi:hypothetical protein